MEFLSIFVQMCMCIVFLYYFYRMKAFYQKPEGDAENQEPEAQIDEK